MNIYIQQIKEISHNNKYTKWYINIVENALQRASSKKEAKKVLGYCEKHHIVPESFFIERKRKGPKGILEGNPEHPDNFVFLSGREHALLHILLIKMISHEILKFKSANGANRLLLDSNGNKLSPTLYEIARKEFSKNSHSKLNSTKQKKKETCLERYGYEFTLQVPEIREKGIQTNLERYGYEYTAQVPEIKKQQQQTNLEKYGYECTLQVPEIRKKAKDTCIKKYGDENYNNREQAKETCLEKYGVENVAQTSEVKEKMTNTMLERHGVDNSSKIEKICCHCGELKTLSHEPLCPKNPKRKIPSKTEKICCYCGILSNVIHESKCILNPNRNLRNQSGEKNHQAKTYRLTNDKGEEFIVTGGLKRFSKEHGISYFNIKKNIVKGWNIEEIRKEE